MLLPQAKAWNYQPCNWHSQNGSAHSNVGRDPEEQNFPHHPPQWEEFWGSHFTSRTCLTTLSSGGWITCHFRLGLIKNQRWIWNKDMIQHEYHFINLCWFSWLSPLLILEWNEIIFERAFMNFLDTAAFKYLALLCKEKKSLTTWKFIALSRHQSVTFYV